ncbi:hypothetical protein EJ08DRAFT_738104 [Tothia fuscella]|uniref:Uncharacterized protein n=1 Tax=Tothia fuscella TaxID=1048955 RepID=A0A9P4NH98_9PEZI|nr:hypothetical protein EJ08DRAFT_738104 [Tothia fuscella]
MAQHGIGFLGEVIAPVLPIAKPFTPEPDHQEHIYGPGFVITTASKEGYRSEGAALDAEKIDTNEKRRKVRAKIQFFRYNEITQPGMRAFSNLNVQTESFEFSSKHVQEYKTWAKTFQNRMCGLPADEFSDPSKWGWFPRFVLFEGNMEDYKTWLHNLRREYHILRLSVNNNGVSSPPSTVNQNKATQIKQTYNNGKAALTSLLTQQIRRLNDGVHGPTACNTKPKSIY